MCMSAGVAEKSTNFRNPVISLNHNRNGYSNDPESSQRN